MNSNTKTLATNMELYVGGDKKRRTNGDKENADELSNFFATVFTEEPCGDVTVAEFRQVPALSAVTVDRERIRNILRDLKRDKSPGPDGLHPRVIKDVASELAEPIWIIFNKSLGEGYVPKEWKVANITAIFKKGDKCDAKNYRPDSLTSVICKVLETIIREQIMNHMMENKLFSKRQYGFLPRRSTVLQLINVMDEWNRIMDDGGVVDVAYCDLEKAFDTMPHRRLLEKVKSYGISGELLKWIESFISGRKQCMVVKGEKSETKQVLNGVPQGLVLGPLLFVIYINDLGNVVENSSIYMYADDTKLFKGIRRQEDCVALQGDLVNLENWSKTWLLKFNPQKCSFMRSGC